VDGLRQNHKFRQSQKKSAEIREISGRGIVHSKLCGTAKNLFNLRHLRMKPARSGSAKKIINSLPSSFRICYDAQMNVRQKQTQSLADQLFAKSFSDALRYLRKRAHLTQDELGRSVGYSREQIARLENGSRLPDMAVIAALFVPALGIQHQTELIQRLLELAGQKRNESSGSQRITITRTTQTKTQRVLEVISQQTASPYILPAPLFPLIGRTAEIESICSLLLGEARLITLIGTPGIGKTRLALEIAHTLTSHFAQGVCFVALDSAQNIKDVPSAIAAALGITPTTDQPIEAAISSHLMSHEILLVLDNCEHVLEAAMLFGEWLKTAPKLKLLCTSRIALDLYGEHEWEVSPLALPDLAQLPAPDELNKVAAIQLFIARIRTANPGFLLTINNAIPIATLCVALDGLPLALELAAARAREIEPGELLRQIVSARSRSQLSSTLLQQTKRNIVDRHRTLHEAIAWSYNLLSPAQQAVFMRMGVIVGGCTLQAAKTICSTDLATLKTLATTSLIRIENESPDGRVTMLETLRSFALEKLINANLLATLQHTHAAYFAEYAEIVFTEVRGEQQSHWLAQTRLDHDNFRSALRFALEQADADIAVTIAGGLWWFWYRQGFLIEGRQWLDASLLRPINSALTNAQKKKRAIALNGAGSMACEQGDYPSAMAYHEEGLALRHELKDQDGIATVLHNMALVARSQGEYAQAIQLLEEALAMEEENEQHKYLAMNYANIGITAGEMNNLESAKDWLERAFKTVSVIENPWESAFIAINLAQILFWQGSLKQAEELAQQSLLLFEELGDLLYLPESQLILAQIAIEQGDLSLAQNLCAKVFQYYQGINDEHGISNVFHILAWAALAEDQTRESAARAKKLFSDSVTLREKVSRALSPVEQARNQLLLNALEQRLNISSG
jgi:predicted ATPase/transcriptional regulator with XRE-family HTH domain